MLSDPSGSADCFARNCDLQFKQVMPTEPVAGFDKTALYYTLDFIRVEGLDNDLMHGDQQHHD